MMKIDEINQIHIQNNFRPRNNYQNNYQQSYYQPQYQPQYQSQYQPSYQQPFRYTPAQQYQPMYVPQQPRTYQTMSRPQIQNPTQPPRIQYPNNNTALIPWNQNQTRYPDQPTYVAIPEDQDFLEPTSLEGKNVAEVPNPSTNITIPEETLAEIFPFEIEEEPALMITTVLDESQPITALYTKAKVNNQEIKLILDSGSAGSLITQQLMKQLGKEPDRPANTMIVTADGKRKLPIGEIDEFPFEIDGIIIPAKVLVMDAPQYQALVGNDWLAKANAKIDWVSQEVKLSYNGNEIQVPATYEQVVRQKQQQPEFEYETEQKPIIETYVAFQQHYPRRNQYRWRRPKLECVDCKKKLSTMSSTIAPDEEYGSETRYYCNRCNCARYGYPSDKASGKWDGTPCLLCGIIMESKYDWDDIPGVGGVCDKNCKYAYLIKWWVRTGTPFRAAFWRACDRMNEDPEDCEMVRQLAIKYLEGGTKEEIWLMKEDEYIEYIMEIADYDFPIDNVDTFHEHYQWLCPTPQIQLERLKEWNVFLCEECLIPCNGQWCEYCEPNYIPLPEDNTQDWIVEQTPTNNWSDMVEEEIFSQIPVNIIETSLKLKYFDNNGKGIKSEKAHQADAAYDLRYPEEESLRLPPNSLTTIDLKIALEIPNGSMVLILSRSSLAQKGINIRGGVIDSGYTGNIKVMLQNETNKSYTILSKEKIAQATFLPLLPVDELISVKTREELGTSTRGIQGFGSTGRTGIEVNHIYTPPAKWIIQLPKTITIAPYGIYNQEIKVHDFKGYKIFEPYTKLIDYSQLKIPAILIHEDFKIFWIFMQNTTDKPIILPENLKISELYELFDSIQEVPNFREIVQHIGKTRLQNQENCPSSFYDNYMITAEDLPRINTGNLEPKQKDDLIKLIMEFSDIIAKDKDDTGRTNITQHRINTGDAMPIAQNAYRCPPIEHNFIKEEVQQMLKNGLIQPSASPWKSPVVLVKKKNGEYRFCVDYRKLNAVTKKDAYPLPRIDEMLDALGKSKYYSTLDLMSGFWQVEMNPQDKEKTSFTTRAGNYEFNVMPFGLTNAPATFQ